MCDDDDDDDNDDQYDDNDDDDDHEDLERVVQMLGQRVTSTCVSDSERDERAFKDAFKTFLGQYNVARLCTDCGMSYLVGLYAGDVGL